MVRPGTTLSEHQQLSILFLDIRSSSVGIFAVVSSTFENILNDFDSSQPLQMLLNSFRKPGEEGHHNALLCFWRISPKRGKLWRREVMQPSCYLYAGKSSIRHLLSFFRPHVAKHSVFWRKILEPGRSCCISHLVFVSRMPATPWVKGTGILGQRVELKGVKVFVQHGETFIILALILRLMPNSTWGQAMPFSKKWSFWRL